MRPRVQNLKNSTNKLQEPVDQIKDRSLNAYSKNVPIPQVTTNDILADKKKMNTAFIVSAGGVSRDPSQIEKLIIQKVQIYVFEPEPPLPNLKILQLSNN